jgi:CheY-like chemotaxis protein
LLAGRKLLLADDSITIQKVVELTFADEGVKVVCVNNGREAIELLDDFLPDVVLADVFMPLVSGYEVCEYIKQNEKLKHIPVMLLVGSFEPFDEEEARRVGANDTLTKPFQSIRRLLDKVGLLTSSRPPEEQIPTAELPKPEVDREPEETLTEAELEITTADTQPLPPELGHVVEEAHAHARRREELESKTKVNLGVNDRAMESKIAQGGSDLRQKYDGAGEVLLDLGDFAGRSNLDEDFVLDIDLDEMPEPPPLEPAFSSAPFRARESFRSSVVSAPVSRSSATAVSDELAANADHLAKTIEFARSEPAEAQAETSTMGRSPVGQYSAEALSSPEISAQQLTPEMIDAIARRAVEHLSAKVVEEIAWEVVPQLAELLIKRQLEEKST